MQLSDDKAVGLIGLIHQVPMILDVCRRTTGMRFVAIARVTDRKWITCASLDEVQFGLKPGDELELQTTICNEVRQHQNAVVFDDAQADTHFREHHTPKMYGFRSYISVPIFDPGGSFFGTLCAIDPEPRKLNTPETVGMFRLFADLIGSQLYAADEIATARQDLADEQGRHQTTREDLVAQQHTGDLREQFIAVVGHDLRNPLQAVAAGVKLLPRASEQKRAAIVAEIDRALGRINRIVDNLLDFAHGRLGAGIPLRAVDRTDLQEIFEGVVAEFASIGAIDLGGRAPGVLRADGQRLGQLLSNLIANAFAYGDPHSPIVVTLSQDATTFTLSVANAGSAIPEDVMATLFQPYHRGHSSIEGGLGLGLFIVAEIAKAHGGDIAATSGEGQTVFTFTMPLR